MHQLAEAARLTGREYVRLFQLSYGIKLQQEVNIKDEIKPQAFCWARVCVVPNKALPTLLVGCSDSRLSVDCQWLGGFHQQLWALLDPP